MPLINFVGRNTVDCCAMGISRNDARAQRVCLRQGECPTKARRTQREYE